MEQYSYTTIIKYRYNDEERENTYYYCSNNYNSPTEQEISMIKEYLLIEDDDFNITDTIANDFNEDEYLSDGIHYCLHAKEISNDYIDAQLAYIEFQKGTLSDEDKKEIAQSILKDLKEKHNNKILRAHFKHININTLNKLFRLIEKEIDPQQDIIKQLQGIVNPKHYDKILLQITTAEYVRTVKSYLDKMAHCYNIKEEKLSYRIAILMMNFLDNCNLLLPSIKGNINLGFKLLSDYYEIKAPTFRRDKLYEYKDKKKTEKSLYKTIKNEHMEFWELLKDPPKRIKEDKDKEEKEEKNKELNFQDIFKI